MAASHPSQRLTIVLIGHDGTLGYLIKRYAEQGGYGLVVLPAAPEAAEVYALGPAAVLFSSIDRLESAHGLVADLANDDIPLLVCGSQVDEARARELGADHCLSHPVTYDGFLAALSARNPARKLKRAARPAGPARHQI